MTAAMAVKFVKNSDTVHNASHQTSYCTLCFDVLSADPTLDIAASALLSTQDTSLVHLLWLAKIRSFSNADL